jgi:hypothetical protein
MTGRSVSWTEPAKLASLLASVAPPRRPALVPLVPAMGAAGTLGPIGVRAAPRAPAATPPAPAPPAPKKVTPRLVQTSDNPSDRLDALVGWTLDHQPCTGAFVADDNGLTLAAHGISEAHVALVGPLLSALVAVRAIPGVDASKGALWLGTNMMSWVETRTERGGFCLGAVGREALSIEALDELRDGLDTTVRGL